MKNRFLSLVILLLMSFLLIKCSQENHNKTSMDHFPKFYKEGHRGTRGYMPENTIPSMKQAITDGANIIEVDIQISSDNQVMVAHDPHINRIISLLPNGEEIPESDKNKYILHQMPYDSIRKFDVGSREHPGFPEQKKMKAYIPLFGELIDSVEQFTKAKGYTPVDMRVVCHHHLVIAADLDVYFDDVRTIGDRLLHGRNCILWHVAPGAAVAFLIELREMIHGGLVVIFL